MVSFVRGYHCGPPLNRGVRYRRVCPPSLAREFNQEPFAITPRVYGTTPCMVED